MSSTTLRLASPLLRRSIFCTARRTFATEAPTPITTSTPPAPTQPSGPVTRTISLARKPAPETLHAQTSPATESASSDILKASEPYTVTRTPTQGLPVYQLAKSGGNLKLTRVRKLGGEVETLRKQLESTLSPKPEYVKINPLTGHIMIKVCFGVAMDWCSRSLT